MSKYTTVSTKIPKELKEKMTKLGIKPSKILRKAIEEEIKKREIQKLKEKIEALKPVLDNIKTEEIVKSIREDREHR
jgi:hypothetical protein